LIILSSELLFLDDILDDSDFLDFRFLERVDGGFSFLLIID
jgi:hypothetical protein